MATTRPILLIEDNLDIRDGVALRLRGVGYAVETATNGAEALRLLYDGLHPGLIICDLMMPQLNGFEFREAQLRDDRLRTIPFVVYSAITDAIEVALHLHPDAALRFPLETRDLTDIIGQLYGLPSGTPSEPGPESQR